MYSLILMAAATGGGDAAGFGWKHGTGCTGTVVYSSCQGSYYGSYSYSGCSGCYGTYRPAGCFGFSTWDNWAGTGCGGCTGCYGSVPVRVRGGFFHRGSCQGSSCQGCSGTPVYGASCFGCSGCSGTIISPAVYAPVETPVPVTSCANIVIEVPAGATLMVDGVKVAGEGRTRNFHTPALPADRQFYYDMRAELTLDGKATTEDLRVVVAGGQTVTKSFAVLLAAAEKKPDGTKVATK